jgi:FSR family fosmidomycin resistance protein-like MFS transporter
VAKCVLCRLSHFLQAAGKTFLTDFFNFLRRCSLVNRIVRTRTNAALKSDDSKSNSKKFFDFHKKNRFAWIEKSVGKKTAAKLRSHYLIKNMNKTNNKDAALTILLAITFSHFLNDTMQALIFATYPIMKESLQLNFSQIGLIGFVYQCTASLLQPLVGQYTDKNHKPYSLVVGMALTLTGLLLLAFAQNFFSVLIAVSIIGSGSSIFHPEASRIARLSSKGKLSFAQSIFQAGGNVGTAIGPLLAAFVVLPNGQKSIAWFAFAAFLGMIILRYVGKWYAQMHIKNKAKKSHAEERNLPKKKIAVTLAVLVALIFSKFFYIESIKSYYTFYMMSKFNLSLQSAQIHLFAFLVASVVGAVLIGGIVGDKLGRKFIIWISILGALPLTLALPYCNLLLTEILILAIGFIMSSSFSTIVVYAQELMPDALAQFPACSSASALAWQELAQQHLAKLPTLRASNSFIRFVLTCRRLVCWRGFCRMLRRRKIETSLMRKPQSVILTLQEQSHLHS